MANKKRGRTSRKTERNSDRSFLKLLGLDNILNGERLLFCLGAVLLAAAVIMLLSFISFISTADVDQSMLENPLPGEIMNENNVFLNSCGSLGAHTAWFFMKKGFGYAAFIIPVFMIAAALFFMKAYRMNLLKWFFASALIMIWASVTMAKIVSPLFPDSPFNAGGDHGVYICQLVERLVGTPGLMALLILIAIIFLSFVSAETIYLLRKILNPSKFITGKVKFTINNALNNANEERSDDNDNNDDDETSLTFDNPAPQMVEFPLGGKAVAVDPGYSDDKKAEEPDLVIDPAKIEEEATGKVLAGTGKDKDALEPYDPKRDLENYHYPTLDLLKRYDDDGRPYIDMAEQTANKNRIVEVLHSFGVEISSIKATVGPTITLYEITPAEGVRISKIRNLEDDIALSLAALGIRIIAPIPGKGTIGIEVPNAKPSIVSMESILNSKKFQNTHMELPIALGKTITNEVFMVDLTKIPHLLVAGATGQGKSVGLNAIITSLLYKKHPAELKFVLIDPKKVEFSIYAPIANHFLAKVPDDNDEPIITDVTKVVRTLKSLCLEMDSRYDLLKMAGARNIKEYNKKFIERQLNPKKGHRFMPYIVVVIDEFGDLIMTAGKEIELPIARIAQLARAVGIHMVIATQRPTTTIITGNIKANFPGRMAFKVSAMIDSRTIIDRPGANQLIGRGDMLFLNGNEPIRIQCAFVDTPELERVCRFIHDQQSYSQPFQLPEPKNDTDDTAGDDIDSTHLDPLFEEAARMIVLSQSGSTSMIQRKYSIGYNRAGRLMDQLEKAGIVGQASGGKPREVLIHDELTLDKLIATLKK